MLKFNDTFKKIKKGFWPILALVMFFAVPAESQACTLIYAGANKTEDGITIFGRSEDHDSDSPKLFQKVPAGEHKTGEKYEGCYGFTWEFTHDSYAYTAFCDDNSMGFCPDCGQEHEHTPYQAGGTNEKGLTVTATETLYANKKIEKSDPFKEDGIEEAEMSTILLSEASNAREAMELLASIYDESGANSGAGVLVADAKEAWYIECISGTQYVAVKLNSYMLFINPNVSSIGRIDLDDDDNIYVSDDLIKKAVEAGCFVGDKKKNVIDFAASYEMDYDEFGSERLSIGLKYLSKKNKYRDKKDKVDRSLFCITNINSSGDIVEPYTNLELKERLNIKNVVQFFKTKPISNPRNMETHIFEIKDESLTGTVEWVSIGEAEYSVFVPHYPLLINDVYKAYSKGCGQAEVSEMEPKEGAYHLSFDSEEWMIYPENWQDSYYWTFEELMILSEMDEYKAEHIKETFDSLQKEIYSDWKTNKKDIKESVKQYYGDEYVNVSDSGDGDESGTGDESEAETNSSGSSQAMETPEEMATKRSAYMAEKTHNAALDLLKEYHILDSEGNEATADSKDTEKSKTDSKKSGISLSTIMIILGAACAVVLVVIIAYKKKKKK
ncbi:MAG: C69 family dipeptidase [Lachnospiraceae bacterium]|nr:C69 family dipeptidase [Lachnospiraceae bacterium]